MKLFYKLNKVRTVRTCPVCGAGIARLIDTFSPNASGVYSGFFSLVECDCGLIYQTPLPTKKDFKILYIDQSQFDSQEYINPEKWELISEFMTSRIEFMRANYGIQIFDNILEIGAGYAWMCKSVKKVFPEYVTNAQDITSETTDKLSWVDNYFVGDISELMKTKKYSMFSLTHVLEHLSEPYDTLRILQENLTIDGIIFITMPHRPIGNHRNPRNWANWSYHHVPGHLQYFNKKSFMKLLRKTNLELLFWDESSEKGQALEIHLGLKAVAKQGI